MFDQVKFVAGLGVFLYAVYAIWGVKKAGLTPFGLGLPDFRGGGAPHEGPPAGPPKEAMLAGADFYGRPIRDAGLPWQQTGWERSDAVSRLTVA